MNILTNSSMAGNLVRTAAWSLAIAAGTVMAPASRALELTLDPGNTSISVGSSVDLKLTIRGLGDGIAPSLGAFDLNLFFNPSVLSYQSVTFGDPTSGNQLALSTPSVDGEFVDASVGVLNLYSVSMDSEADLDDLQAGGFVLANVRFLAIGEGIGDVSLSDIVLGDAAGATLDADTILGSSVKVVRGAVTVPEGGMFYPGLFLLAFSVGCTRLRARQTSN